MFWCCFFGECMRVRNEGDRGNREFLDVFLVLGSFFLAMAVTMIFKEKIDAIGGFSFILKLFFISCAVSILFGKLTTKSEHSNIDVEGKRHEKNHYRHPLFFYIMNIFGLFVLPALIGMLISGMFFQLAK